MLASLAERLVWKPTGSGTNKSKQKRAPTATFSELGDSSDDVSETESVASSQCSAPVLYRHQSCPSSSGPHKTWTKQELDTRRHHHQPQERSGEAPKKSVYALAIAGLSTSSKLFSSTSRDDKTPRTPLQSVLTPKTSLHGPITTLEDHARGGLTSVGTRVSTSFGLGTIVAVRNNDGVLAIDLPTAGLFYLGAAERQTVHVVPALVGEHVRTRAGRGRVVQYNARAELYVLRQGDADGECRGDDDEDGLVHVPLSDVLWQDGQPFGRARELLRRSRSVSDSSTSSGDCESLRRTRPRLSSTSSSSGLTLLKSIATTSYTFIASKYHQGQPVITKFGAGHIVAVDPQRGSAQIQLVWGASAFLSADMIDWYPKALEGTDVHTKFGSGVVIGLRPADAIYTVRLHDVQPVGKSDVVFVHESDLHRSRKLAVTAANVRDRLKAMAHRCFGERIVVAHQSHDEEPNSAGI